MYNGRYNRGKVVKRMMKSGTMVNVKSKETVNMREDDTPDGPMWKTKILNNS